MRVLVTGAASGIGRATCLRIARDHRAAARIAAVDIAPSAALDSLLAEIETLGGEAVALLGDLGDSTVPARVVGEALERFGGLDALVSNAGINCPGPMMEVSSGDWDRVFAVNVRALVLLCQAAFEALSAAQGAVVSVASMSGGQPHANLGPYGPSKAAAIMTAKVLAQELGPHGIRVNTLSPGMVKTGMTEAVYRNNAVAEGRDALVPIGRVAEPADMADVIAFLLGPDARYVHGHDLIADGGLTGNLLGRLPGLAAITRG